MRTALVLRQSSMVLSLAIVFFAAATLARAADTPAGDSKGEKKTEARDTKAEAAGESTSTSAAPSSSSAPAAAETAVAKKPKYPPYAEFFRDADDPVSGLVKTRRKGGTLYAEIEPGQLNRDFIIVMSIAKGSASGRFVMAGMSWNFGDDPVWQFRKMDDYVHVVRRNVRFSANKGSPEEKAVSLAFTDSVLYSLPISTISPSGAYVVDLNQIFMSDLPQISHELPGFAFSAQRSTWASVKGFKNNVELEVAATYASSGTSENDNIPDSRGATINVHYSISYLPQTGFRPRLADDRVGYFLTVLKDYSKKTDDDQFVRYINRWDLQKADPTAEMSPPKKPIVFWLEKTIPYKYRAPIREGFLEWNKAFEKAGFKDAIEVRQQPDNADWDPENIEYNTFRWITTNTDPSMVMSMGPSRVNPLTGEILNAMIIFDSDFLQSWKTHYETFTPANIGALTGGTLDLRTLDRERHGDFNDHDPSFHASCGLPYGRGLDFAFGGAAIAALAGDAPKSEAEIEKLQMQGLRETTMHEVGHTLGLRHNFKASAYMSLADIDNPEKEKELGYMTASVMDYAPVHIVPKGQKQGDYYSTTIGPYDMWAIEYGYKPVESEKKELAKIAAHSAEPALQYATDEDVRGTRAGVSIDSDPLSNQFDLGREPMEYVKQRAELISSLWSTVTDRVVKEGDGYQRARQAFGVLLSNYGRAMHFAARYVSGVTVSRSHKGDTDAGDPFVVVDPQKQRDALELLEKQVFSDKPFHFPPELYNHLAATRWDHWGVDVPLRTDYPVHEVILMWQQNVLDQLLSPFTLQRLHDSELKVPEDKDAFTTAELINRLTKVVFSEVDTLQGGEYTNRKPAISSLRRNLQREYLSRLSKLAMGESRLFVVGAGSRSLNNINAPSDCETVAYAELKGLQDRMNKLLASNVKLDDYTRAHLTESSARIGKVLEAKLDLIEP
jgi:hypothetical protein